jgi:hypothetical protein
MTLRRCTYQQGISAMSHDTNLIDTVSYSSTGNYQKVRLGFMARLATRGCWKGIEQILNQQDPRTRSQMRCQLHHLANRLTTYETISVLETLVTT